MSNLRFNKVDLQKGFSVMVMDITEDEFFTPWVSYDQYIGPRKRNCLFPVMSRKNKSVEYFFWLIFLIKNMCFMHDLP